MNEKKDLKWNGENFYNPDNWEWDGCEDFNEKKVRQPWDDEIDERARRVQEEKCSKQREQNNERNTNS